MTDKMFEQLNKAAKNIRLSDEDKSAARRVLAAFINRRPVNAAVFGRRRLLKTMPLTLVFALLAGGGMSYAAEGALPGDLLYAVKISFNEEVRALLATNAEDKADWETKRVERRLEEVEKLAADGRLDAEAKEKAESNFEARADKAQERITELRERRDFKTAASIGSRLEASLRAHEQILSRLAVEGPTTTLTSVASRVRVKADAVTREREDVEAKFAAGGWSDVMSAAEGKMDAAENKIAEVRKYFARFETAAPAAAAPETAARQDIVPGKTMTAEAESRLQLAEDVFAEAEAKFGAGAYGEAFVLFQKAERTAQEAKLLLDARRDFRINLKKPRVKSAAQLESNF